MVHIRAPSTPFQGCFAKAPIPEAKAEWDDDLIALQFAPTSIYKHPASYFFT